MILNSKWGANNLVAGQNTQQFSQYLAGPKPELNLTKERMTSILTKALSHLSSVPSKPSKGSSTNYVTQLERGGGSRSVFLSLMPCHTARAGLPPSPLCVT